MNKTNNKIVFLNLFQIRMPVTAVLSILHRLSGVLLAFSIPWLLYFFAESVRSEQSFAQLTGILNGTAGKTVFILMLWLLCHHFCAGLRFLCIDLDIWVERAGARASAWAVNIIAVLMTVVIGGMLL